MPQNSPYIKALEITNYRAIKKCKLDKLGLVNIIGGANGTGKTTVLEAIFSVLDRRGMGIVRPFQWRGVNLFGEHSIDQLFHARNTSDSAEISLVTREGLLTTEIKYAPPPRGNNIPTWSRNDYETTKSSQTAKTHRGLLATTTRNRVREDESYYLPLPNGIQAFNAAVGTSWIPTAAYSSAKTRNIPNEDAERLSAIRKQGKTSELLHGIQQIAPHIRDIEVLFEAGAPVLYATLSDNQLHPVGTLGDGAKTVISLLLSLANLEKGVYLIDEFESSIHYATLPQIWQLIFKYAAAYQCQIFVVTHSLECIRAAASALDEIQAKSDTLSYTRIESKKNGETAAIRYSGEQLISAINEKWEVR